MTLVVRVQKPAGKPGRRESGSGPRQQDEPSRGWTPGNIHPSFSKWNSDASCSDLDGLEAELLVVSSVAIPLALQLAATMRIWPIMFCEQRIGADAPRARERNLPDSRQAISCVDDTERVNNYVRGFCLAKGMIMRLRAAAFGLAMSGPPCEPFLFFDFDMLPRRIPEDNIEPASRDHLWKRCASGRSVLCGKRAHCFDCECRGRPCRLICRQSSFVGAASSSKPDCFGQTNAAHHALATND